MIVGRLGKALHRFWYGSIYRQVMLAFTLSTVFLMLVFGSILFRLEQAYFDDGEAARARTLGRVLAASAAPWVEQRDIPQLQRLVDALGHDAGQVRMLAVDGRLLAATASPDEASPPGEISPPVPRAGLFPQAWSRPARAGEAEAPVMDAHGALLGWVRVGYQPGGKSGAVRTVSSQGLLMVGFAFLAIVLGALSISSRISGGVRQLMQTMNLVLNGRRDVRANAEREDELGKLARSFNGMLDSLAESERKLERINRVYAAWTRSNEMLVRENDEARLLQEVCHIMAECVPFNLVWIGLTDAQDWVGVAASSNPASTYLRDHVRISVDPHKPEGRVPMAVTIREGVPQILNDFLAPSVELPWRAAAAIEQFRSVATFPLRRNGRCVGAIGYYSSEADFFDDDVVALMQGLAADVSYALDGFDHEAQRKAAEAQLILAARVFENSMEGIVITDAQCNIISVNPGFTEITGYSAAEIMGKNPRILSSGQQDRQFYEAMWESIRRTGAWRGEIRNRRKNGEFYPEWLTISRVLDEQGEVANYIGVFSDISERKNAEARIQHLAFFDALTDLPNRTLLRDRLDQAIIKAQRAGETVAVLYLDLDRFKAINDTLGHEVGDQLLKMIAGRLLECVREQDTVSRQGGDEFIAVLPGTDAEGAVLVVQKILAALAMPCMIEGHALQATPSIGISLYPQDASDIDELIRRADAAMYQAKNSGRNTYRFSSEPSQASA